MRLTSGQIRTTCVVEMLSIYLDEEAERADRWADKVANKNPKAAAIITIMGKDATDRAVAHILSSLSRQMFCEFLSGECRRSIREHCGQGGGGNG